MFTSFHWETFWYKLFFVFQIPSLRKRGGFLSSAKTHQIIKEIIFNCLLYQTFKRNTILISICSSPHISTFIMFWFVLEKKDFFHRALKKREGSKQTRHLLSTFFRKTRYLWRHLVTNCRQNIWCQKRWQKKNINIIHDKFVKNKNKKKLYLLITR